MKIVILLYEGVDLLDFGGPYEVFLTASRLVLRDASSAPFDVVTATLDGGSVAACGGLGLTPYASLGAVMPADVLIVPGTIDIDAVLADKALLDAVSNFAGQQGNLIASVCTGAFVLAEAGLLAGREWTTHWEDIDLLAERLGVDGARRGVRWVDSGEIVTAAGLSSGIAMALHLVDRITGRELAVRTAAQIDYKWTAAC